MFAPISRTYSHPFRPEARSAPLPPYVRNRLAFPRNVEENVAFLREWQQRFAGDSFDFDYHFVWDHYADPGYTAVAAILHEDIRRLRDIGLNGYVSCQTQRACFPTGLGQVVLGRTLWGSRQTYDEMAADYYAAAFGADAAACREYLETLTRLFDPVYLRGEKPGEDARAAESLEAVPGVLAAFRPAIERNRASPDPCRAASWRYLAHHAEIAGALSRALALRARGNAAEARKRWEALARDVWRQEDVLHTVLDAREFVHVMGGRFPPPP
jgi:hypothetical protein